MHGIVEEAPGATRTSARSWLQPNKRASPGAWRG